MPEASSHSVDHAKPLEAPPTFEAEVLEAIGAIRTASAQVIEATAAATGGQPIRKASHLQRALGVPLTIAWQVFRMAAARDLLSEAQTVPGPRAVEGLIRAARDRGVRAEPLDALSEAVHRFERVVRESAGDRKTFNSIVAALAPEPEQETKLNARRSAYRANSQIRGVQVRTRHAAFIVHPSSPDAADVLSIVGAVDLCRLHGETPYQLACSISTDDDERILGLGHPLPAERSDRPGCTLLSEFCSQPLPTIHSVVTKDGKLVTEMSPDDLGRRHAVTAFIAEMYRSGTARYRKQPEPNFGVEMRVTTPIMTGIVDLIFAEGVFGPEMPAPTAAMAVHAQGASLTLSDLSRDREVQILERPDVLHLGTGSRVLATPDVPRLPEMFEHVCARIGWDPSGFHTYRCRVEYPVLPSSIVVGFALPEQRAQ